MSETNVYNESLRVLIEGLEKNIKDTVRDFPTTVITDREYTDIETLYDIYATNMNIESYIEASKIASGIVDRVIERLHKIFTGENYE